MKNGLSTFILAVCVFLSITIKAQVPINYIFTRDSLNGFDEQAANAGAAQNNCFGQEYKSYMYKAKRNFIIDKYSLQGSYVGNIVWTPVSTASVQPGCSNVDFEAGTYAGWTLTRGSNTNSQTMAGCCPNTTGMVSTIVNSSGNDPVAGALLPLASPFGGAKIAKLNDATANYSVERISQTFGVTSSNAIFQFAYAGVLEAAGHACTDQPYINVTVLDSAGNILACPQIVIVAPSALCSQAASVTAGWTPTSASSTAPYYHAWDVKTIDLSPYIGSNITIQITVGDCNQGGHYGYGYFDCRCNPLEVNLNNGVTTTIFDATSQTPIDISTCGSVNATIGAPTGLNPYTWDGPAGSGVSGVTTQTVLASTPGTYTLTMNPQGNCYGPIVKYMILHVSQSPTASAVAIQPTCANATGSGQVSVSGGTGPFTYSWNPTASNSDLANGLTPGNNYTIMVVDSFGCSSTTSISINPFPDAPTFTITPLNGVLTCNNPTLTLTAMTGTNTVGAWVGTASSPTLNINSPGTYTCVLTNTVSVGQCSTTVNVTVVGDTLHPTATPMISCNTATISLNATANGGGIALGWLAPTLPTATPVSNPGSSTATGIYTLTATNLATGCKTTYTVSTFIPNIVVSTNPSNNLITCTTPTVQATATSTASGVTYSWTNGVTTSTTNPLPITTPGTYTTTVMAPGGCSSQTVITIASNTTANASIASTSTVIPCSTNNLDLTASGSGGSYTYSWTPSNPSFTGNPYSVSKAGTYTVVALNTTNGCTATATYSVSKETVTAGFTANPTTGLMPLAVSFTNTSSSNATDFEWGLGNSSTTYTTVNTSTIYEMQGTYNVILIAYNGFCSDTAQMEIIVDMVSFLTIPNVFTPNGDGKNDKFTLSAVNIGDISMTIFDRWGLKMYDTSSSGNLFWDGKTKSGSDVADGTYFYVIRAKGLDGKDFDFKGTVNVFR